MNHTNILKSTLRLFLVFTIFSFSATAFAENLVIGKWKTIDDATHQPRSIIEIYEEEDGTLSGRVDDIFLRDGEDENLTCTKCKGDKKDQPVMGMVVLTGLEKKSEDRWAGGTILDADNGKTYSCKVEVIENGDKLKVRGFIGVSLLGRTQIWIREPE